MPEFSHDEINIMCIYDTGTRKGLISELKDAREYLDPDQVELRSYINSCIRKLEIMSDEQYAVLSDALVPDFFEDEQMKDVIAKQE